MRCEVGGAGCAIVEAIVCGSGGYCRGVQAVVAIWVACVDLAVGSVAMAMMMAAGEGHAV